VFSAFIRFKSTGVPGSFPYSPQTHVIYKIEIQKPRMNHRRALDQSPRAVRPAAGRRPRARMTSQLNVRTGSRRITRGSAIPQSEIEHYARFAYHVRFAHHAEYHEVIVRLSYV